MSRRPRRRWSLQRRLILTVIGIVSLILVIVAVVTSVVLGRVLESQLDDELRSSVQDVGDDIFRGGPSATSYDVLQAGRQQPGFLLTIEAAGAQTGAWVSGPADVTALTSSQLETLSNVSGSGFTSVTLTDGLGEYRLASWSTPNGEYRGFVGLPMNEVRATIAQMLATIALVTAGGLLLLVLATAWTIRAGLRPLRTVADTAARVAELPLDQGNVSITERVPQAQADDRTEIGQVGAALNTLLDHVDASLEARERNEARMRSFVADASHELRTPLASIRGYSELSLRAMRQGQAPADDDTESALERIQAQSLRMTTLVEDLLLLARLDEGQELVYGTVELTRLAIEAVGDARAAGPDHGWVLDVGDEPIVVAGDETRIHQVVTNLLANARTHTPRGTEVTVSLQRDDREAVLRVHDDGPGIDPQIADELFERFSRADRSRARKTGGTGLGLSIARAIVQAHSGSIAVRSAPGDTTFEVRLPAQPAAPPSDEAPETDDAGQ